jgi:hypothetical protein
MREFAPFIPLLLFLVAAVGMYLAHAAKQRKAEERQRELLALADRLGLQLTRVVTDGPKSFWDSLTGRGLDTKVLRFIAPFEGIAPFGQGHTPQVRNVLSGTFRGYQATVFDYSYKVTTSNGKSTQTVTYEVQVWSLEADFVLPSVEIAPENISLRIMEKFGLREVEFESAEFNRKWFVRSEDAKGVYDVFHPQAMERFMDFEPLRYVMSFNRVTALTNSYQSAMYIYRVLNDLADLLDMVPNYVREDGRLRS